MSTVTLSRAGMKAARRAFFATKSPLRLKMWEWHALEQEQLPAAIEAYLKAVDKERES